MDAISLERIRTRIYEFLKEIEERFYLNWVGLLDDINIVGIYEKYADLFTREQIEKLKGVIPRDSEEKRLLKRLLSIIIMNYFDNVTKELVQKKLSLEATLSFDLNGRIITYRSAGPIMANEPDRSVRIKMHGELLNLTPTEFRLLACLMAKADQVLSCQELVREVQNYDCEEREARDIIRVHIRRLRKKVEPDPSNPQCILNLRGVGYMFASPPHLPRIVG